MAAGGGYLDHRLASVTGSQDPQTWVFDAISFDLLRRELGASALRARLAIGLLDRPLEPGTIRIEFVAAEHVARGRGIGQALLDAVAASVCKMGSFRLGLHVEPSNIYARRHYERAGFEKVKSARESLLRWTLAPQTDRRMIKELTCTTY